ncbi:MAG: phosphotransferase [bacterium]|nr:phosphotransferase [bacterium]
MKKTLESVLQNYDIGVVRQIKKMTSGLIHQSFRVNTESGMYTLQAIHDVLGSNGVFADVAAVMDHLAKKNVEAPQLVRTREGGLYAEHDGHRYRLQTYVEGDVINVVESEDQARAAGAMLGRFHAAMADIDHQFQTELGLHRTGKVIAALREVAEEYKHEEIFAEVADDVDFVLETLPALVFPDSLPKRVMHGDPKISNVVFRGGEAVAMIDLDTCDRLTVLADVGDAFRSWCGGNESAEENHFRAEFMQAGLEGYLSEMDGVLTEAEHAWLPKCAKTITLELVARFLTDYFRDTYFGWDEHRFASRRAHNLRRARNQLMLFKSIS